MIIPSLRIFRVKCKTWCSSCLLYSKRQLPCLQWSTCTLRVKTICIHSKIILCWVVVFFHPLYVFLHIYQTLEILPKISKEIFAAQIFLSFGFLWKNSKFFHSFLKLILIRDLMQINTPLSNSLFTKHLISFLLSCWIGNKKNSISINWPFSFSWAALSWIIIVNK